MFGYTGVK